MLFLSLISKLINPRSIVPQGLLTLQELETKAKSTWNWPKHHPLKNHRCPRMTRTISRENLLIGTWVAIALIGSVLVKKGVVARDELLEIFDDAETASLNMDRRHVAMGAVRIFVERIGEAQKSSAGQTDRAR